MKKYHYLTDLDEQIEIELTWDDSDEFSYYDNLSGVARFEDRQITLNDESLRLCSKHLGPSDHGVPHSFLTDLSIAGILLATTEENAEFPLQPVVLNNGYLDYILHRHPLGTSQYGNVIDAIKRQNKLSYQNHDRY